LFDDSNKEDSLDKKESTEDEKEAIE